MVKARVRVSEKEVVLLGLIAEEPIHAYGLEQKMRERRITEWADIGFSSIYRVLDGLTKKRLITTRLVHAGQGATRKVHEITERGQTVLASGVAEYVADLTPMKTPLSVGLAFAPHGRHVEVVKSLQTRAAAVAAALEDLVGLRVKFHGDMPPKEGENDKGMPRHHWLGAHLLFDHFQCHVRAEHEFLVAALRLLDNPEGSTFFDPTVSTIARNREVKS